MNITEHQQIATVQYCFPDNNSSCRKEVQTGTGNIFLFTLLSFISVCTLFFNLLVIISISHFKQLHTPTNLLVLSLAVADLLVGLILMPVKIMDLIDNCWYLGKMACAVVLVINFFSLAASLCSMTLIAVDRYIAVNDPLIYSTKITVCKTSVFIIFGWLFCLLYVFVFLYFNDHLLPSQIIIRCHGECVLYVKYPWMIVDLIVMFITPCSIILILYSFIFNVARRQTQAVRSVLNSTSNRQGIKVSNASETKAAKTLGIVVCVYLACWIPFYLSSLSVESMSSLSLVWTVFGWLAYINSSINPLIYAIFYPWFRTSAKYIVTCRTLESSSSRFNLFQEHF
ncbi:trace amine-associated receptor 13c-like [Electrophorus electricus]|uniref:trace amine-associated receptor 13c-like n=1 Tax=Electrophorus electricus TaxID=8005 RepID=UPI0015D09A39|nr:trace amine-associated receptor 13c-like [Electrophorus electricus]